MKKTKVNSKELLFHYTKLSTALFHILPNKKLLLNPIAFMNDIYEMDNRLENFWRNWQEEISGFANFEHFKENKIKIISFVKDDKVRGFDNQLMWSFYGEKYQGVCLVFDKKKLVDCFKSVFGDYCKNEFVSYEHKNPEKLTSNENINLKGTPGYLFDQRSSIYNSNAIIIWKILQVQNRYFDLFFRKNNQWAVENEYRFLVFDNRAADRLCSKSDNLYIDYMDSLVGVIVGPKIIKNENWPKLDYLENLSKNNSFNIYYSSYKNSKIVPIRNNVPDNQKHMEYDNVFLIEEVN